MLFYTRFLHIHSPTEFPRIGRFFFFFLASTKRKRGNLACCPSHCSRLSHCPNCKDWTTQKPTHEVYNNPQRDTVLHISMIYIRQNTAGYNIPTVNIHRCLVLLQLMVICEITNSKRQAFGKRPFHKVAPATLPLSGLL